MLQHHQWLCFATEGGAQDVPVASAGALAQGQAPVCVPPSASILHCAVPGEGRVTH